MIEDVNGKEGFEGYAETKDTSTYPMLFVSLKKTKNILMKKKASKRKELLSFLLYAQQGVLAAHRTLKASHIKEKIITVFLSLVS